MRLWFTLAWLLLASCNHGLIQPYSSGDYRTLHPQTEWAVTRNAAAADLLLREGEKRVAGQSTEDYQAALENQFEPAMRACSECPRARAWLAISYIRLIEVTPRDANTFVAISKLVDPAFLKGEVAEETVVARAEWLRLLGRNEEALSLLNAAIASRATAELRYQRAAVYVAKGMPIEAAVAYPDFHNDPRVAVALPSAKNSRLLAQFPNYVPGRLALAQIALDEKNPASALEILRATHSMTAPEKSSANALEARALAAMGDSEGAISLLEGIPAEDSFRHLLLSQRVAAFRYVSAAEAEEENGHWKKASDQLFAAAMAAPDNAEISTLSGEVFLADHRYSEAKNRFLKALKQSNGIGGRAAFGLALARIQLREPNPAEFLQTNSARAEWILGMQVRLSNAPSALADAHFAKAQTLGTHEGAAFTEFGRAAEAAKNLELAEFYYSLALRYEPYELGAMEGMASVRFELSSPLNAIAFLSDKLVQRPDSVATEVALAMLYLRAGDQLQGKNHLLASIRRDSHYARAFVMLGRLTRDEGNRQTDYSAKRHSYRYALASFEMAAKLTPEDPEPIAETANLYFDIRDLGAAARNYYRTAQIAPWYPNVHLRLAQIARNGGDNQRAQELLKEELRVNKYGDEAHVELGNIFMTGKYFSLARSEFEEAVKMNPRNGQGWFGKGVAHHLEGAYNEAAAAFITALEIDPLLADAYWQLGLIYRRQGRDTKAILAFMNYKEIVKEPSALHQADEKIRQITGAFPVAELSGIQEPAQSLAGFVHERVVGLEKSGWMMRANSGRSIASSGATRTFSNQYAEMQIPAGWECELQAQDWVCQPGNPAERGFAFLVVTAKIKRAGMDELPAYLSETGKARFYMTMSGESVTSEPRYARMLDIEGHPWVEALQLGWESPGYYSRLYSTLEGDLGVMVSFSVRRDYYRRYSAALTALEASLRVFRKSGGLNDSVADTPNPLRVLVSRNFEELSAEERRAVTEIYAALEEANRLKQFQTVKENASRLLAIVGNYRDTDFFESIALGELSEYQNSAPTQRSVSLGALEEQGNLLVGSVGRVVYREALRGLLNQVQKLDAENPVAFGWSEKIEKAGKREGSRLPASLTTK
jgi:tetratricopeptide (TPR) repeat protein